MKSPIIYDVSHLNHPEPLEIMTEALSEAMRGEILEMRHRREPLLLYDIIQSRNLAYKTLKHSDSKYTIYIAKADVLSDFLLSITA